MLITYGKNIKKRKIVYIPTIHHCLEKRDILENILGTKKANQYFFDTKKFWKIVDVYIKKINVKIDRIFWESWTGTEKELAAARKDYGEITNKLTDDYLIEIILKETGRLDKISNIVLELIKKDAVLEETESRKLLNEHKKINDDMTRLSKKFLENKTYSIEQQNKIDKNLKIIQKRDRYIAKQINDNLLNGETGILLIGKAHNVLSYLSNDIEIITDSNILDMAEKINNKYFKN